MRFVPKKGVAETRADTREEARTVTRETKGVEKGMANKDGGEAAMETGVERMEVGKGMEKATRGICRSGMAKVEEEMHWRL